jgi:hypothetical protein
MTRTEMNMGVRQLVLHVDHVRLEKRQHSLGGSALADAAM